MYDIEKKKKSITLVKDFRNNMRSFIGQKYTMFYQQSAHITTNYYPERIYHFYMSIISINYHYHDTLWDTLINYGNKIYEILINLFKKNYPNNDDPVVIDDDAVNQLPILLNNLKNILDFNIKFLESLKDLVNILNDDFLKVSKGDSSVYYRKEEESLKNKESPMYYVDKDSLKNEFGKFGKFYNKFDEVYKIKKEFDEDYKKYLLLKKEESIEEPKEESKEEPKKEPIEELLEDETIEDISIEELLKELSTFFESPHNQKQIDDIETIFDFQVRNIKIFYIYFFKKIDISNLKLTEYGLLTGGRKKITKQTKTKLKGKHDDLKMKDIKELCKANKIKLSRVVEGKRVVYKKKELITKLKRKKLL
jgi:hypothetical protein